MSSVEDHNEEALNAPLLENAPSADNKSEAIDAQHVLKALYTQAYLATPLVINYIALYLQSIVVLMFVGHLGTTELAAVAFGNTLVGVVARLVLIGLSGALDTQASQAYGAGHYSTIPVIFQRTTYFLWAHCIPISAALVLLPQLLKLAGSKDEQFTSLTSKYLIAYMPAVWVDAVNRSMNRILLSQRVTSLQMWVAVFVLPLHIATSYFFIHPLGLGYLGAAAAQVAASVYILVFTSAAVAAAGLSGRVWGKPSWAAFKGWSETARFAYPACIMKCAESWAYSSVTVWAGLLPDPTRAVAAVAVAFSIQGTLFMPFAAAASAVTATVGNALGDGDIPSAKAAAVAAGIMAPVLWVLVALVVVEPHCQAALLSAFGGDGDPILENWLRWLMILVAVVELFDGSQTMMAGVIQGCGKQRFGAVVNLVSFYVVAVPLSLTLAFHLNTGVKGLYGGMITGPMLQLLFYVIMLSVINWRKEADAALKRVARTHTYQLPSGLPQPVAEGETSVDPDVEALAAAPAAVASASASVPAANGSGEEDAHATNGGTAALT